MKKLTEFLEKNVQWVAIGLGAVYLLWMVYSFVLTNAAWQIDVGGEKKSPGEVDESVAQIAQQLKSQIDRKMTLPFNVPNFQQAVDLAPKKLPDYSLAWANSPTQDVPMPAAPTSPDQAGGVAKGDNKGGAALPGKIVELPKAPAATDLATVVGRSNVIIPEPIAPVAAAGGNPQPAPAQPAANTGTDIDWITVSYKISLADLAREFQRTQMPSGAQGTTKILDVELMRQEMQADGSWGPSQVCPKLTTSTQPPGGCPADDAPRANLQAYLNWASGALPEIVQPTFYQLVKGDPWTLPKELIGTGMVGAGGNPVILGPNDVRDGFDPNSFVTTDQKQFQQQVAQMNPPLTNKEKQLIAKARSDAASKAAADKSKSRAPSGGSPRGGGGPPGGGGGGGRGGPGGGRGDFAPEDIYRPAGRPPMPMGVGAAGGEMEMGGPQMQQQQGNFAQMFPLPNPSDFDPRLIITANAANASAPPQGNQTTIVGWAHDWKPDPGKTYRYMIRYKIKNPIWATRGFAKEKPLEDQFSIVSMDSGWTAAVLAPPIVQFYFASGGLGARSNAQIDVYRHQNGTLHKERFNVLPGDTIGAEKGGIDYGTGFTLVDLRPDLRGERVTAWLITPEGMLVKRDIKSDMESPLKQELDKQIQAAAAAGAAASAGGATGGP